MTLLGGTFDAIRRKLIVLPYMYLVLPALTKEEGLSDRQRTFSLSDFTDTDILHK